MDSTTTDIPIPRPSLVAKLGERNSFFGLKRKGNAAPQQPVDESPKSGLSKERTMSIGSYASTMIPPVLGAGDTHDGGEAFGGSFQDVLSKRKSAFMDGPMAMPIPRSVRLKYSTGTEVWSLCDGVSAHFAARLWSSHCMG